MLVVKVQKVPLQLCVVSFVVSTIISVTVCV